MALGKAQKDQKKDLTEKNPQRSTFQSPMILPIAPQDNPIKALLELPKFLISPSQIPVEVKIGS